MSDVMAPTTPPAPATPTQKLAAEAIGAAILVYVGLNAGSTGYGFTLFALVLAFGAATGGHFNPATSVGAAMAGRLAWKDAGTYAAAQVVGGLVAGIIVLLTAITTDRGPGFGDDAFGAPGFGDRGADDLLPTLILELVISFAFVLVVLALTDGRLVDRLLAPLGIGLAYVAAVGAVSESGSAINPAQALSTVFWSGGDAIVQAWLFVLVPLVGAALAGLAHPALFGRAAEPVPGSGLNLSSTPAAPAGYAAPGQWGQPQQQAYPGGYDPQAYAAPQAQAPAQEQPIIQDGWQWDPQSQQWIPAQQQPPAPQAPQAPQAQQAWQAPADPGQDGPGGQTQIRPPGY